MAQTPIVVIGTAESSDAIKDDLDDKPMEGIEITGYIGASQSIPENPEAPDENELGTVEGKEEEKEEEKVAESEIEVEEVQECNIGITGVAYDTKLKDVCP